MRDFLILKLQGVMQAWGGHTFEDFRPSHIFPTRSGLAGLLGASLGIDRQDKAGLENLSASFTFAARLDKSDHPLIKFSDFHTVKDARKVDGKKNKHPVVSIREYLCDAKFTLALFFSEHAAFSMETVKAAIQKPRYTQFLGRRSCPLTRPLYESAVQAETLLHALNRVEPFAGTVYSEEDENNASRLVVRDAPIRSVKRQFAARTVYIIPTGANHVSEQSDHPFQDSQSV